MVKRDSAHGARGGPSRKLAGKRANVAASSESLQFEVSPLSRTMGAAEDSRNRVEEEEEAVDLLRLLIEQVVDYAIFVVDKNGNIASWNPGAERIKGYAADEIIGKPYSVFFTDEDRAAGKPNTILSHARTDGRYQEEGWRVRKDGSCFWASVVVTALHDRRGAFRGFAKITRDLTERRQAEEAARVAAAEQAARRQAELDEREMRWSRDQLDLILRSITEGVTVQTAERKFIFANDAAAHLCGFDSADAFLAASARGDPRQVRGPPRRRHAVPARRAPRAAGAPGEALQRRRPVPREADRRRAVVVRVRCAGPRPEAERSTSRSASSGSSPTGDGANRRGSSWRTPAPRWPASLDYEATLKQVAELAVPTIADWSAVDILIAGRLARAARGRARRSVQARAGQGVAAAMAASPRTALRIRRSGPACPSCCRRSPTR